MNPPGDIGQGRAAVSADAQALYERVDRHFYLDQTQSKNPLRRWFHLNRYRIANLMVKSKYEKGQKIIDFGCGSCDWNTDPLPVFGVDYNPELLDEGKKKHRLYDYFVGDGSRTGLPDGSFDLATSFECLEYLKNYEEVVREGKRLLKDGGHFIVSVPYDVVLSLWRPLFFLQVILQGYILRNAYYRERCGHVNHFSAETIRDVFIRNGFDVDLVFDMRKFTIFLRAQKPVAPPQPKDYADITVVLPTLNEVKNIRRLLETLRILYPGSLAIVSDDGSHDGTRELVLERADKDVWFLDRRGSAVHGLTASVLDAVDCVETRYFVVIDADGQHPPEKIGEIVNMLRTGSRLVIASRVAVEGHWGIVRHFLSYVGTALAKTSLLLRGKNYTSYDVLGGFFGGETQFWKKCQSQTFKRTHFRLKGYKVLFDFLKYAPSRLRIDEVYYRFETRRAGVTKINLKIYSEFLKSCFLP